MREVQVDELVRAMSHLGALPLSLGRLAAVTGAPEFDFSEVVDVVGHDMVLTAGVLRVGELGRERIEIADRERARRRHASRCGADTRRGDADGGRRPLRAPASVRARPGRAVAALVRGVDRRRPGAERAETLPRPASEPPGSSTTSASSFSTASWRTRARPTASTSAASTAASCARSSGTASASTMPKPGRSSRPYWELPPAIVEGIRGHHEVGDDLVAVAVSLADMIAHAAVDQRIADELQVLRLARVVGVHAEQLSVIVESTSEKLASLVGQYRSVGEQ